MATKDLLGEFSQSYLFEDFLEEDEFFYKKMFGCLAIYFRGLMVCMIAEDSDQHEWNGKKYKFPLWNGLLFPTERVHHESLIKDFPALFSHPVLGKWLYLPMLGEEYEQTCQKLIERIRKGDPRLGILPGTRKRKKSKAKRRRR